MGCYEQDSLYFMFGQVIKLHYHRIQKLLDKLGLYHGQPPLLFILHKKNGQSQKELADKMNIKPATITVMLKRMEKSGFVERLPDKEDQRVSRVYLTDKGRETMKEVKKVFKSIDDDCFKNFTQEEKILLRRLFMQMRDNLLQASNDFKET
ncbi:DNA-binding MarR family transcriptional regulator [Clostridium tetanomorphum]|uniref:MarR family transcriptional regulator n=1 Tax=Clostridium tetanomorphum TaxID=1553 RepID=A0A923J0S5_CLOTT|nr:MarR family transcriptional regulator [Clostridium tetanomorphum]KAJ51115.1 MarR-like transcriptional regulator [Clostridium tetanomorphum DSM 665]MBC2398034.1 MarR family transcriptional regulator [Clostridium tetanomorphum]MBP1864457.1 DNA-binding MarR family transcriptional regulator [Clostridium tetanomorphum]NRS83012.1 DNA-binding MarR family transcriptional regulator [Clostridium tetanomorphum]NRZ98892.1 DNA-binding MarR family transcriptional regulator [Clostridium tetanomorphum]